MADFNTLINKEISEILRIERKGSYNENYCKGLCIGVDGIEKYLVIAVKRCKLICTFLNYGEVSVEFPRCEINDISEGDFLDLYVDQKIVFLRYFNDENSPSKSFFLLITKDFQLRFDKTGLIDLNNR